MADNTTLNAGTGGDTIATDDIGGVKYQRVKLSCGADGSATDVTIGGGVEAAALRVTIASDSTGVVSVDDNGASLTVDNAALSVTGGGVEASAMRVTIASDSTGVLSVDDNGASLTVDNAALSVTGGGVEASALRVTIASDSTGVLSVDDNGGSITIDNADITSIKTAVEIIDNAISGSEMQVDVVAPLPAGTNNIGDVDVLTVPSDPFGANADAASATGSISAKLRFIASTGIPVTGTVTVGSHAVTNAGTFATQIDGAALTSLQLIDDAVSGAGFNITQLNGANVTMGNGASGTGVQRVTVANDSTGILAGVTTVTTLTTCSTLTGSGIAHDGADSGNPHKIGAKAETALSGITLVADGDRSDLYCGVDGVLIVRPECNLEDVVQERTTNTDGASTAFASGLAAPGAGIRLWVKSVDICNSSASFCTVDLRDGAAGSVLWTLPVPATGGVVKTFNPPLKLTANTALAFDASAATTTLTISANGFKSKV